VGSGRINGRVMEMRAPVFLGLREDKKPADIIREG
jgi:hypothetical protein